VVGLAGGLGGFVLPIMFGALVDLTGVRSSAFMLLYGTVCVSLVWMHYSFRPATRRALRRLPPPSKPRSIQ
jgi:NNP family nitrate/nitrite transporter-like MFS transporter